ncbi:MAG TPA: hypothetical protein VI282_11460 [Verrucomicrobiae bacterium]|jgi:hypothetical protein
MSTVAEIVAALPRLTGEELSRVEREVHRQVLQRSNAISYDDAYGVVSDKDLIASADEAFQEYDKEEAIAQMLREIGGNKLETKAKDAKGRTR